MPAPSPLTPRPPIILRLAFVALAALLSGVAGAQGPTATLSSVVGDASNLARVPFSVSFSAPVVGFDTLADVNVANGHVVDLGGADSFYNFSVIPSNQGLVTVRIPSGAATDLQTGAASQISNEIRFVFDTLPPSVSLATGVPNPTNVSPVLVAVQLSEPVSSFPASLFSTVNATLVNFAGSGMQWSFELVPGGPGTFSVRLEAGTLQDSAGNVNPAPVTLSRTFNGIRPTAVMTSSAPNPTNVSPIHVLLVFSKAMQGLTAGDVATENAAIGNFFGIETSFSFDLFPFGDGIAAATLPDSVATDLLNNPNLPSPRLGRYYDGSLPTLALATSEPNPTDSLAIPMTATFSEPVSGFAAADIVAGNATVANFAGSGAAYTFRLLTDINGTVTASVPAGVAEDAVGNRNIASPPFAVEFFNLQPRVTLSSTTPNPTNAPPIFVDVQFERPVTGFGAEDIILTNASLHALTGSGAAYRLELYPLGQGEFAVDIPDNVAFDSAGRGNRPAATYRHVFDARGPRGQIFTLDQQPIATPTATVSLLFDEPAFGLSIADFVVDGGRVESLIGSGKTYSLSLRPSRTGGVAISLPGGAVIDAAGNPNRAVGPSSLNFGVAAPVPTLSVIGGSPSHASPLQIAISFSAPVIAFTVDRLIVTGAQPISLTGGGRDFTAFLTPDGDGTITVTVPAFAATSLGGVGSFAGAPLTIVYDATAPTVAMSAAAPNPVGAATFGVSVEFSEPVVGVQAGDFALSNATMSGLAGNGSSYSFNLTAQGRGFASATIAPGAAADPAGNALGAGATVSRFFDPALVPVNLSSSTNDVFNTFPIAIDVAFGRAVSGLTADDFALDNARALSLAGAQPGAAFTLSVAPLGEGPVTVSLPGGAAHDASGGVNASSNALAFAYDGTPPAPLLASSEGDPTRAAVFGASIDFGEPVSGFALDDLVVATATAENLGGGPRLYTFDLRPYSEGFVSVSTPAGAAFDAAGNPSVAAAPLVRYHSPSAIGVLLASSAPASTALSTIPIAATFEAPVSDFALDDLDVENAVASNLAGGPAVFTFDLHASAPGDVAVRVRGQSVLGPAGRTNVPSNRLLRTYDTQRPTVEFLPNNPLDPTNATPLIVTVRFSEPVTGFALGDLVPTNATLQGFSGSDAEYAVSMYGVAPGAIALNLPAGAASDAAGNANLAAAALTRSWNPLHTNIAISSPTPLYTNASVIPVATHFVRPVAGFEASDLLLTNATVDAFVDAGGGDFAFDLIPDADGVVIVEIPFGVATTTDGLAMNLPQALGRLVDRVAPTVAVEADVDAATGSPLIAARAQFSEPVAGFTAAGIVAGNADVLNLTGDGTTFSFDLLARGPGEVALTVAAEAADDIAGNANLASATLRIDYADDLVPVVLASATTPDTNASPIPITIDFGDDVEGFDAGGIEAEGATVQNFAGSGASYTAELLPAGEGTVRARIPAGVALATAAAKANAASELLVRRFDATAPTVAAIRRLDASPTAAASVRFEVEFTEPVAGLLAEHFAAVVTGGTLPGLSAPMLTGGPRIFQVAFHTGAGGATLGLRLQASGAAATDAAGNAVAGLPFAGAATYVVDSVAPETTIVSPAGPSLSQPDPVVTVSWMAANPGDLARLELYYRKDGGPYGRYGGDFTTSPIGFDTRETGGSGHYEMLTIGIDSRGNIETPPATPDADFVFTREYRLELAVGPTPATPGSIAAMPSPSALGGYPVGTQVTLTATPGPGAAQSRFSYWEMDGVISGFAPTLVVTMDADKSVRAIFSAPVDDIFEENDDPFNLPALPIARSTTIENLVLLDEDWFAIALPPLTHVRIKTRFSHALGDINTQLWDRRASVGTEWGFAASDSFTRTDDEEMTYVNLTAPGVIYLRVYGEALATNPNYALEFETVEIDDAFDIEPFNNDFTCFSPPTLALNQKYPNLILRDDDWYKFDVAGVDRVDIRVDHFYFSGNLQFMGAASIPSMCSNVFDRILFGSFSNDANFNYEQQLDVDVSAIDTLALRVFGETRQTNFYDLTVSASSRRGEDFPVAGASRPRDGGGGGATRIDDPFEPNGGFATATPLSIDGPFLFMGDLYLNNEDWYAVHLPPLTHLRVQADFEHAKGDLQLQLWDRRSSVGDELGLSVGESYTRTNRETLTYVNLSAPTVVYLRVYGEGGATNDDYSLQFNTIAVDDVYDVGGRDNNTACVASPLPYLRPGFTYTNLVLRDDDWFRIDTRAIDVLHLRADHFFFSGNLHMLVVDDIPSQCSTVYDRVLYGGYSDNAGNNFEEIRDMDVSGKDSVLVRVFGAIRQTNLYSLTVSGE